MKIRQSHRLLFLAAALVLLAGGVATVKAVGTLAGTSITNQAYADYKDANNNALPRVYSNTVTTVVSQVAGVDIVPPTEADTGTNGTDVIFMIQIFNTGNGPDVYDFSYLRDGGTWDPADIKFYWDANNNHVLDAAEIAAQAEVDRRVGVRQIGDLAHEADVAIGADDDVFAVRAGHRDRRTGLELDGPTAARTIDRHSPSS